MRYAVMQRSQTGHDLVLTVHADEDAALDAARACVRSEMLCDERLGDLRSGMRRVHAYFVQAVP